MAKEMILERDRVECFVHELSVMLQHDAYYEFKIRFLEEEIVIIPHARPVEIDL